MKLFINNPFVIWVRRTLANSILMTKYKGLTIKQNVFIENSFFGEYNFIGENVSFRNSKIGDYSYVGENATIGNCSIGRFCSIGPNAKIGLGAHPTDFVSTHPVFYANRKMKGFDWVKEKKYAEYGKVEISSDVWIGANAFVKTGVTIGVGAIVASGAVVTKDVEPFSIVGGVPAKVLKSRFDESTITRLMETAWWEEDLSWLKENAQYMLDVDEFLLKQSQR